MDYTHRFHQKRKYRYTFPSMRFPLDQNTDLSEKALKKSLKAHEKTIAKLKEQIAMMGRQYDYRSNEAESLKKRLDCKVSQFENDCRNVEESWKEKASFYDEELNQIDELCDNQDSEIEDLEDDFRKAMEVMEEMEARRNQRMSQQEYLEEIIQQRQTEDDEVRILREKIQILEEEEEEEQENQELLDFEERPDDVPETKSKKRKAGFWNQIWKK